MKGLSISLLLVIFIFGSSIETQAQRDRQTDKEESTSAFYDNFWWGANAGLQFSGGNQTSYFIVGLEPMLGYKLDENGNFSVGPKLSLEYTSIRYFSLPNKVNSFNYGGGLFARAKVYRGYFAHIEYEKINETIAFQDGSTSREWSDNYFLGGGVKQGGDRVGFEILILLNLAPEETTFNQTPVEYRFGFNVNF